MNDTYGHHNGDQLLMHVIKVCQTQLKEGMLFTRYGGEEFVLALKGRTGLEGEELANQLRRHVEARPLITTEGVISVTLSSGVAEATKATEETLYQLLNKADQALYSAKREGRNQVRVYSEIIYLTNLN
ncbi:GGDEF domain-containing protein [Metabacillus sediminilitoris]|uniref:GGDEF domain-containing protein n=1 Tax=Metabacillus sediminilitoris TaxID=2567941 RepID=UPI001F1A27D7|nr:GGDEF domain-containing protein [Metabacillus sediminilitoris]